MPKTRRIRSRPNSEDESDVEDISETEKSRRIELEIKTIMKTEWLEHQLTVFDKNQEDAQQKFYNLIDRYTDMKEKCRIMRSKNAKFW